MRHLLISVAILVTYLFQANAAAPVIWKSSEYGQFLTTLGFELNDGKQMRSLTVDPTAGAGVAATIGTIGVRENAGAGELWLKVSSGNTGWAMVATKQVSLTSDVTGVLPVANGGTNSSTALNNNRVMISSGGAIVENGALTAAGVLFADANGLPANNATYFQWDNVNNRLGIGVGAAGNSFTLSGIARGSALTVSSQGGANEYNLGIRRHSATDNAGAYYIRSRGSEASPSIVSSGDIIGNLNFVGYDGTDYEFGSKIEFGVDGTPGNNDMPGNIVMSVSPDGSNIPAEALRISNDKKVTLAGTLDTALTTAGPTLVDGSGVLSSEAYLDRTRGGTGITSTATFPASGTVVTRDAIETLTNKTIDADSNTITNIENADIKVGAAIDRTKLASGTASHVLINDGTGVMSSEAQLDKTRGGTGISSTATFPASGTIVTRDATETLTNKTLTSPVLTTPSIDVATLDGQASVPTSPSAGNYKLYVSDTTQKVTLLNSAGNAITVGPSELITNLLINGDAEAGTTGWTGDSVSAATRPSGSLLASSAGLTFSTTTSSPLSGNASFTLAKDGLNRQGQLYYKNFDVPLGYRAKRLQVSMSYMVTAGTFTAGSSSTDSDMIVYLREYNGSTYTWSEPSNFKLFSNSSSLSDNYVGDIQFKSDTISADFVLYIAATTTNTWTVKFDSVSVSPQGTTLAPVITDWKSWTPTGSWSANSTYTGKYRQVGSDAEFQVSIALSGAPTSANLTINLPLTIDTAKLLTTDSATPLFGSGNAYDNGVSSYPLVAAYNTSTSIYVFAANASATYAQNGTVTQAVPFTFGNTDRVDITFKVPILGWSSGLEIGDNYSGREISVYAHRAGSNQTGINTNNSAVKIAFNSVASPGYDSVAAFDTTNNRYDIKSSGKYKITASINVINTNVLNSRYLLMVYKNGSEILRGSEITPAAGTYFSLAANGELNLIAGDYLELFIYGVGNNSASTYGIGGLATESYFMVSKLASPAAIASGEKVAARYTTNAGQSITNGTTPIVVDFEDASISTHGIVTTGASWKFTAQTSGVYKVKASVMFSTAAWTQGYSHVVALHKNGTAYSRSYNVLPYTGSYYPSAIKHEDEIQLNAGDYIDIRALHDEATARTLFTSDLYNYISITKL